MPKKKVLSKQIQEVNKPKRPKRKYEAKKYKK